MSALSDRERPPERLIAVGESVLAAARERERVLRKALGALLHALVDYTTVQKKADSVNDGWGAVINAHADGRAALAVSPEQPGGERCEWTRVTGIEVVGDGPDTVVTLITAAGRHPYALDETLSSGLEGVLRGLRSAPAATEAPPVRHFTQAPWDADPWLRNSGDGFEAFGVGEAA